MPKITEIKKLKRLYKVTFSDSIEVEGDFSDKIYLSEDSIVHFFLSVDRSFTEDEVEEWLSFDQFARGKALALYHLGFKARTAHEVRKYLIEHEILADYADRVLDHLQEIKVLDDENFAENFIQGKINMASSGPYQIKQKLMQKGIASSTIDKALENSFSEEEQIDVAYKLAEKYARSKGSKYPLKQLENKIVEHLMGKGFNYSVAKIALESLELEADEEEEADLLYRELDKVARRISRNYEGYELKQRITQALARKGFSFDDISRALRDYDFDA
ncbi:recombination regulator RecX [Lactococcus termiticola]|uniref:Regulatory protein RecX n=1 Tax=Lactococcus termiticola TaxID=2169526 RepID=A0A2R5HJ35_9LACT|nr:recombination regulator RecX [Lactococcus termiticola]GBG96161.1 regulatory protein RecX [Lactococcus termiticola]